MSLMFFLLYSLQNFLVSYSFILRIFFPIFCSFLYFIFDLPNSVLSNCYTAGENFQWNFLFHHPTFSFLFIYLSFLFSDIPLVIYLQYISFLSEIIENTKHFYPEFHFRDVIHISSELQFSLTRCGVVFCYHVSFCSLKVLISYVTVSLPNCQENLTGVYVSDQLSWAFGSICPFRKPHSLAWPLPMNVLMDRLIYGLYVLSLGFHL